MTEAYYESFISGCSRYFIPKKKLASLKSEYQQIDVVELGEGKALFIDNVLQIWTLDEFIYHEMLSHMSMLHHPEPRRVLILGGGEGFLAREILKYPSVEQITIVDIDQKVVDVAREFFSAENGGSLDDRRVKLVIDDARKYAKETADRFDVILMDLIDPYRHGAELYAAEQIGTYAKLLARGGVFALHCEDANDPNNVGLKIYS